MRVMLNGVAIAGCRATEIASGRSAQAASFRVKLVASDVARHLGTGWVDQSQITVTIDYSVSLTWDRGSTPEWVRMITGTADRIVMDQVSGEVTLHGRDHAARLIDLPLQEGFLNKTSSDVAVGLAEQVQLTSNVDVTTGLIGQYFQIQHTRSVLASSSRYNNAWDLLVELADLENFELWVDGTTLYFKQPSMTDQNVLEVTYAIPGFAPSSSSLTISSLSLERSLGLGTPSQIEVASWNSRQRRQVTASYPSAVDGTVRKFQLIKPNLLPDEAEALAKNTYTRLRAHERVLTATMAGELVLTPQHRIRLTGTGTAWDQTYTIDRIEREMSLEGGFLEHLTARADTQGIENNA